MNENELLRLAMMLENQAPATLDKYLCKLAECVLFDSDNGGLTLAEICEKISVRFQLQFDLLELESAMKRKGKGRIEYSNKKYQLLPKIASQISTQTNATEHLASYIKQFKMQYDCFLTEEQLLQLVLKFLYHSFNSSIKNFINIIGVKPEAVNIIDKPQNFTPSNDEINLINAFIAWDNNEKNKLFYSIVSCSYEYCMLTTKKNAVISERIFKEKRFILDTNIIFRMAGINTDERQFVVSSFAQKCKEVGIELCYTNEIYDEITRVVDGSINGIQSLTNGQNPINNKLLENINPSFKSNDFYSFYYNWCKEPQNKYYDFISFREFLTKLIVDTISGMTYITIPDYKSNADAASFSTHCTSLKEYKNTRRPYKKVSDTSLKTDINNILYVNSLRSYEAKNIWQLNNFLVSADQLFSTWAKDEFSGIPLVMIPSIWLSIILKLTGRTTDDNYKSYCLFLELRQHRTQMDEININPVWLLGALNEKTIEKDIKEKVITEITTNRSTYIFDSEQNHYENVERAFDKILSEERTLNAQELQMSNLWILKNKGKIMNRKLAH